MTNYNFNIEIKVMEAIGQRGEAAPSCNINS